MVLNRGDGESLPGRREGYTQKAVVGGQTVYLHTGQFEEPNSDGTPRLGEIFVDLRKAPETLEGFVNAFALAVSIGLQGGIPLERFVEAFTNQPFSPQGVVSEHNRVTFAKSVIDYVFRDLGVTYLGRDDLAQLPPPNTGEQRRLPS